MCLLQEQTEWKKKSQSNNDGKSKILKKKVFFLPEIFYITLREEKATLLKPDSNFMQKCSSTDGKGYRCLCRGRLKPQEEMLPPL